MNKGLHRIIFSKKHSTMVAVAETANSQGKGKQAGSSVSVSLKTSGDLCGKLKTTLKTLVCSLVSLSMVLPAHAQITTDKSAPKNQQVVILKTNTGAPLVNIQTPNGRGLSHNRYTQFDVDNKGAVLNNDRNNNPFVVKGSAQLILNEVRGTASKLNGIVTVGGQKADVIIANPNGITVNGGGFKNVGRGILTTGAPQIGKDGALTGFDVRQGTLTVGAAGWNDKGEADYTGVLARAVALQGKLQGKNLAVSTGPQKVDYASGEISAGTAAGTKPTIALDTAALGGMYADSITLIANEKGVGVKNAGTLEAAKQLIVTSSGRIENSGRIATTADGTEASPTYLSIETTETGAAGTFISNDGRIESKGLLVIDTGEDIGLRNGAVVQNNGNRPAATVLNAGRNLVIESKANVNNAKGSTNLSTGGRTVIKEASIQTGTTVYSSSKGNAELGNNTRITGADVTVLSNGTISSSAVIDAKDTAHIEAGKPLSLEASTVTSDIRLNGGSIKGGKQLALLADDNITAKTTNLNTPGNLYVHTGKDLNLNVDKDLSAASIHLKSDNAAHITGTSKTLTASKDMGVEAGSLNVTNTNLRTNSGNLHIQAAKGNIQLRNTKLNAAKALETTALQGNIVSDGLHAVSADGHVSLLANGNADFTGHNTLTAKADVNAGSVGKGRLKADNTNITSSSGDITLVAGNGIQLGDGKQRNSINGKHISIKNNGGNADLKNLNVHAKSGALNIHSDRALSIENTKLESTHNTHLNAQHERVTLNQVDAYAHRHLSITGSQIWQNDKLPSANKLVANGVLALNARYSQIADNTTLRAGAINLTAGTALVKRGNINWSTVSTKTLEDNAELKPLAGRLNIEAGSGTLTIEPANRISAHTDLSIKTGGKLLLSVKGGNAGAPSAQVSSLEAKGNIRLVTGETDLRGSKITAGKNLVVATTKGKLNIEAVNNSFSNYFPTQKAAELNAGISAGINTAVNGGSLKDNLGNAALGALVNSFQGEAASKIKTTFSDDYVAKQFAHALAGCVSGLVQGKCKDGAIGAAVGEIVAESILGGRNPATLSDAEKHKVISYSKIIAGSVAALNGGDVNTAANAAEVAVVNNALNFDSTPTNAKKHQPQKPDKTALEKIIQSIMPAHAAGAMTNPQDKDAAIWISNIRNGITGPIVITSYGVYAAGWTAPLIGTAGKLAISTCMANPSGCTVMVTQAAEAGAGIATGAVTVGNAWEAPVGALSKAKAAKQAAPKETINNLANLAKAEQQILFRIAQRDTQLDAWKTGFNNRVRKGAGLLDASNIPITINGKTIKPVQAISLKGAPVYSGVSEQEIFALYRQMTGQNPNFRVLPDGRLANGIISTGEWAGTKIALRNFSKTENSTQARWTLDLQNPPSFIKGTKLELKFQ
ncbi:TPA: filamentous hemagglutinin N-terminal domain-containing protein [Neisseria meningitidis]|uniref:two-partner secretion domain-containing protein n=4 Tax=Neisseria meningitidis TaxID=487 RepID=UPI0001E5F10B|nr:DUF637 domain-containing protein [Neisseria meningitidis]ADO31015.1 putative hemagglutinin [Neisseria meningitidis alpha710]